MTDQPKSLEEEGDETIIASSPEAFLESLYDPSIGMRPAEEGVAQPFDATFEGSTTDTLSPDESDEGDEDCTIIAEMPFDGRVGQIVAGRYTIMRIVGEGGVAMVYEAEEAGTKRMCALKVLKPHSSQGQWRQRFEREVRIAALMKSPYIVEQLDAGVLPDNRPYLVQELLYGETLADRLERGPIDRETAVKYTEGILEALKIAHGKGIVHRDMKPENVFLSQTEGGILPKVLDFGFAFDLDADTDHRLTAVGMAVGTPRYMAPEQFASLASVSARTDLYAVGLILHEMLRGEPTFSGDEEMIPEKIKGISFGPRLGWVHMHCPPPPIPGLPPRLTAFIAGLLEKDPEKRIPSAEAALAMLRQVNEVAAAEPVYELNHPTSTMMRRVMQSQTQMPTQAQRAATLQAMQRQAMLETMALRPTGSFKPVIQVQQQKRGFLGFQKTDWILLAIAAAVIGAVTTVVIFTW